MSFSTPLFLFFFLPLILTAYFVVPRRARIAYLLVISLLFYVWSAVVWVVILLLAILVNFTVAIFLSKLAQKGRPAPKTRLAILWLGVLFNLSLIVSSRSALFISFISRGHAERDAPLGISFLVLALISYVMDVYHEQVQPARNLLVFAGYASLFAKIVAGPIVRYKDVAVQLVRPKINREGVAYGVKRFVVGLAKKVLIADVLAVVSDEVFSTPVRNLTPAAAWLGVLCYGLQIYYDFSGYSDMAIGLGRMFGFKFLENFNYPYIAKSLGEFWRRWHISLSSWLRDYVYLPLAYSISRRIKVERPLHVRADMWAYALATLTTMFLCGLWHGAIWGCIIWGLWHGLFLTLENTRIGKRFRKRSNGPIPFLLTQWVVLMGWVFFRAGSLEKCASIFRVMYGWGAAGVGTREPVLLSAYLNRPLALALFFGLLFCGPLEAAVRRWNIGGSRFFLQTKPWILSAASYGYAVLLIALLFVSALAMAESTYIPFVYQQF